MISDKRECINKCVEDDDYKYEFRKKCYKSCPEGSIQSINNTASNQYYCQAVCTEENPFEILATQECVKNCNINDIKNNLCILNYKTNKDNKENNNENKKEEEEDLKEQELMNQNVEESLASGEYNTSNLDNGEDDIIKDDKMTITITTTQNQKDNKNNNMTVIDLGECETLLRKEYKIPDSETLYMKKVDLIQEGMKIPKVEYDVYCKFSGTNLVKLNLTVCKNSRISLSVPVEISESLDKLNSSSGYYNDICYVATSDKGTDISLKDRKTEFIEGKKTVCQDGCDFSDYDYKTQKADCSCKVKESSSSILDMKINTTQLKENFMDVKNIANINLMGCYDVLFSLNGIKLNIACFSIIPIAIFHISAIIIFYASQKSKIFSKISDIQYGINNWDLVVADEKEKKRKERRNKLKKKINKNEKLIFKKKKENLTTTGEKNNEIIHLPNELDYYYFSTFLYKPNNPPKKNKIIKNKNNININTQNKENNFCNQIDNDDSNRSNILNSKENKDEIIVKSKEIMSYTDQELNELTYPLALKLDKRTFCTYYISLIKTRHILFFSFFYSRDYNSRIIKIDLFFISFTIYFAVNALFFNDKTMHKIYEDQGSFNLVYQLPQIAYSSLISSILNFLLKLLALSESNIINLKKNKNKENLDKRVTDLNQILNKKFIFYYIISTFFLLFSWYYLSMFCAIYRQTQYHLIKDTLISFGISLIYPFGLYLLPGMFRIPSLSNSRKKRIYLYSISKLLQII